MNRKTRRATMEEIISAKVSTDYNCFNLFSIKKVYKKSQNSQVFYDIFLEGGLYVHVTPYHAFVCVLDGQKHALTADKMHEGDQIWIDVDTMFKDGMITVKE